MASSGLQGLNLIQPESPPSNLTDAQDLLSGPLFPDLTAQLDLWTHVNFASDEPFISSRDREAKEAEAEAPGADSLTRKEAAHHFTTPAPSPVTALPQQQFDFSRFLAEFGLSPTAGGTDGLALQNTPGMPGLSPNFNAAAPTSFGVIPAPTVIPAPAPAPTVATTQAAQPESSPAPPAKRARTTTKSQPTSSAGSPSATPFPESQPNTSTPLTAAEDKRRRNTAASARFRLKKKEREAALDARAHGLEERVAALERECEGLRRENGWLRGLVVGVTGGVVPTMSEAPIVPPPTASGTATAAGSEKRKRDEEKA